MYDETKDQWALCSPMNLRRGFLAGVTISHGIIALGGENEQGPLSDVEWYDACTGKWTVSAKMLEKVLIVDTFVWIRSYAAVRFICLLFSLQGWCLSHRKLLRD
jgi:hypothetical protein